MGFISEILDFVNRFSFYDIIHEYQQGLLYDRGVAKEVTVRHGGKELEDIVAEETRVKEELLQENCAMGYAYFMTPFVRPEAERSFWTGLPKDKEKLKQYSHQGLLGKVNRLIGYLRLPFSKLPEGWGRNIFGMPKHPKRYEKSKVLRPGFYFFMPVLQHIVSDFKREKVLNLENITVPTVDEDSKSVIISCNIRYELIDFYKAYTAVHDYEVSLKSHTLSIMAKYSRGKKYEQWKDPKEIDALEENVLKELREIATEKWGLQIHRVYVTDNVSCNMQRVLYEGQPLPQR